MKFGKYDLTLKRVEKPVEVKEPEKEGIHRPVFSYSSTSSGWVFSQYNGETEMGSLGPVKDIMMDREALRARGWEVYLTNDTVQTIIGKLVKWVIACGLRLQAEPIVAVLKSEGINITPEQAQEISDLIEARFSLFMEQKKTSYNGRKNLNQGQKQAYLNVKNGGDVLVILRYIKGWLKYELVDGVHVRSPQGGDDWNPRTLDNGNHIVNGVEMNDQGEHVAYHIQEDNLKFKRVMHKSPSTGLVMAYLVGGHEYRLDYVRCIPVMAGLYETIAGMERYKKATLANAEETANIPYMVLHGVASTGENPMMERMMQARNVSGDGGKVPIDDQLKEVANKVAASTQRTAVNLPKDSRIEPLQKSKAELYFKDFYSVFFESTSAAVNMPPNVAAGRYDGAFNASRASIKDFEHTMIVERYNFATDFLQPIYEAWLHIQVLEGKISLPGYQIAYAKENRMITGAYTKTRWVGDNVPHIDPLKEVMAIREMLGETGKDMPLIDHEGATEMLGNRNAKATRQQYSKELQETKDLNIKTEEPPAPVMPGQIQTTKTKKKVFLKDILKLKENPED